MRKQLHSLLPHLCFHLGNSGRQISQDARVSTEHPICEDNTDVMVLRQEALGGGINDGNWNRSCNKLANHLSSQ
ncbi:unnamed protein product [Ceratitis capitata]|uniref:(Mediterranean fruit fly) hypothetical protein n=1 Tax=Ceratitis capitata TaxID=7213 RepID=A0A811UAX1_CERCA|nr:unnamed protein product [Ceratitis capitata]